MNNNNFDILPDEILVYIIGFFDNLTYTVFHHVCRRYKNIKLKGHKIINKSEICEKNCETWLFGII